MRLLKTFCAVVPLFYATPAFSADSSNSHSQQEEFTEQYCLGCHNAEDWAGGLAFDTLPSSDVTLEPEIWEKVIRKLRVGMMPPPEADIPPPELRQAILGSLTNSLDQSIQNNPNPGPALVRRLNRAEYQNAIRDLLDLEINATELLPPDDPANGFDNNAEALGTSPVLVEQYLSAAGVIAALAIGDQEIGPNGQTFRIRQDASQNIPVLGMPVGTVGGGMMKVVLPLDGEYHLDIKLYRSNLGAMKGLEFPHDLEIAVDGERIHLATIGGENDFNGLMQNISIGGDAIDQRSSTVANLTAGPHDISVGFVYKGAVQNSQRLQAFLRSSQDLLDATGHPHIEMLTITGPYNATGSGDTPSRRRIFSCRPKAITEHATEEERQCAQSILTRLARQAYRGTDTPRDVDTLMEFFELGRSRNNFESGIQTAIERLLTSPKFTFRVEHDPVNVSPGSINPVSDLELASRLSFFLWSTGPDEILLELATQGQLSDPVVLDQQVKRMLADSKSRALVDNFASQWLYLRNLKGMVPNSTNFPDFDDNLRQALLMETEMFFESVVQEDRNVLDLMTANYTYLNERLARHYNIPNVYGAHFRKVTLENEARWGLLGKGSIQMISSHTDRTSPIVRGKWVLENLLGSPPPAPPPDIPALAEVDADGRVLTLRESMEVHRANPACASCHAMMDPIGYSMENFNAVGAWREYENGSDSEVINASGRMLDGSFVTGPIELRQALLKEPEIFISTVVEKLMTYALGRGIVATDMPVVRKIVRDAEGSYQFSEIITGIVRSVPFQMRISSQQEAQFNKDELVANN